MDISAIFEIEKINGKLWIKLEDFIEYDKRKDKEIERLEEEYVILQNASDEVEDKLQERIDEAIEYMKEHSEFIHVKDFNNKYIDLLEMKDVTDVINILQGSDKE